MEKQSLDILQLGRYHEKEISTAMEFRKAHEERSKPSTEGGHKTATR